MLGLADSIVDDVLHGLFMLLLFNLKTRYNTFSTIKNSFKSLINSPCANANCCQCNTRMKNSSPCIVLSHKERWR